VTQLPEGPWTKRGAIAAIVGVVVAFAFGAYNVIHEKWSSAPNLHGRDESFIIEPIASGSFSPQPHIPAAVNSATTTEPRGAPDRQTAPQPLVSVSPPCKSNSDCASINCFRGFCAPESEKNGPCDSNENCASGLRCIAGACIEKLASP
jgi:hypothetical protein